jgi:hypothetical protein
VDNTSRVFESRVDPEDNICTVPKSGRNGRTPKKVVQ